MALHALNRLKVVLCLSCSEQAESWPVALHVWEWNSPCVSSCLKQVETCAMSLVLWTGWKLACVSSCLEQADSHPIDLFMLWTGWNPTCASSCFKVIICHVSLHALNRLKLVVCLILWTDWKLTCGSSWLRLKVTLCLFMLWTGWHLTCACPCFKAETHPVSLHASNRLKLMLCLSCFEINRLKVTLCLFMLWTGWNLACASSCFKGETHPMSLHAFLKQVETCAMCLSCIEINRLKVTLCLFMLWPGWNLTCASSCFKAETRPMALHALTRLKVVLCLSCFEQAESWPVPLHVWGWKSPYVSSCFEQDEIWAVPPHALKLKLAMCLFMPLTGWNLCYVPHALNRLKVDLCLFMPWTGWQSPYRSLHGLNRLKVDLCLFMFEAETRHVSLHALNRLKRVVCLMLWRGWKLTCGSSCLRVKVTLCLFMLWTRWNLSCASSCFKAETRHVSLHAFNGLKLVLCPSCFEQAESWPVALHVWGWKSPFASSCFEQDDIWPVPLHASKLKLTQCLFMPQTGWNLCYVYHALKLTGRKSPFVSSCFEQDEIWPVPPHASKVKLILCLSMP